MANTLGLDDDLDPVEVAVDLEQTFAFKFSDEEARGCITAGDIYAVLLRHAKAGDQQQRRCSTAMAYYRLRQAFRTEVPDIPVTPATPMRLFNHLPAKALLKRLCLLSSLRLPKAVLGRLGGIGAYMILFAILGFFLSFAIGLFFPSTAAFTSAGSVAMVFSGPIFLIMDRGKVPSSYETVGDLARLVALMNFGSLVKQGARCTEALIWLALVDVLSKWTTLPKSEIGPDTVCLWKIWKAQNT
ncbi:MAG: hypothetical protein ACLPX9_16940 [Rhodomicrobium sp.]